ncbi:resolvase [Halobacteriales archaeon QS_8_65_32]|jgi:putative DNA-invertase from lambdoid prophage Rac|nr:MAG: resolvase [Halobacteriales archaeon QS_8_65_32]
MDESTVIYTRVASRQRSTADQRQQALDYATEVIGLGAEDVLVLSDRGAEARADDSSGYQRLSSLVVAGEIDRVIITDASRIATNIQDLKQVVSRLVEHDVAVHVIDDDLRIGEPTDAEPDDESGDGGSDTESAGPGDETVLWALEVAARLDESIGAERTKEGIDTAKASGKHVGRPPFGFDSQAGRLVPNGDFETAVDVIERIEAGESTRSTARYADVSRATVKNIVDRKDVYAEHDDRAEVVHE